MNQSSDLLRLSDAARYLGVSRRWLYRRIWSGELPASKVGGLYFIRKADLDALIVPSQRRQEPSVVLSEHVLPPPETTEPLKCGHCFRLITTDTQIGDVCQAPDCEAILCADCWAQGARYCVRHQPDRESRWQQAIKDYRAGKYPVLVRSEQARFREVNFLERFRLRLEEITALRHPQGDEVLTVNDWKALEHYEDDRAQLMDLLGVVALDADTLARYPLNARVRYEIPLPKHWLKKNTALRPLALEARVLSHLETMVREGFDTSPFSAPALRALLLRLAAEVEAQEEVRLVVLAATTGWDPEAQKVFTGTETESPFVHRDLLVYLYDMERQQLLYNVLDPRLERYANLLHPALPAERVAEAARVVEQTMGRYDSLTLAEALKITPYDEETLKAAFEHLAAEGAFALVTLPPDEGWALVRK